MRSIGSRSNPLVKRLHALAHSARDRRKLNQTLLDGLHLVETAQEADIPLREVVVSDQGLARDEIGRFLAENPGLDVIHLPDELFNQVSPVDTPSGVMAIMDLPESSQEQALTGSVVILDHVQDPGNLGAIIRTTAAVGIRDVLLTPGCAQPWSPRALRAGMGGQFVVRIEEQVDATQRMQAYPGQILATALCGWARPLYDYDLQGPVAWLFGGEGQGLTDEMIELSSGVVLIPMCGGIESLNVAAAAAVCLFEQFRQCSATHHWSGGKA
jgi:RNA methyltransferase, TrmH family